MLRRVGVSLAAMAALCLTVAALTFADGPVANTGLTHFDTIVVLGCPAEKDGAASPDQRERVMEGVREYRRGIAPRMIVTGGAAHNAFIEARVMAEYAKSQGIPAEAIFEEPQAKNTIQNAFYSGQMMARHHWRSAEVVSSAAHVRRAALIFTRFSRGGYPVLWRVHAASWPPTSSPLRIAVMYFVEITKVFFIRIFGFAPSPFLPPDPG